MRSFFDSGSELGELLQVVAGERLGASELPCDQADVGKMLHRFHAHEGILQGVARRDHAMVGQQNSVMIHDQGLMLEPTSSVPVVA